MRAAPKWALMRICRYGSLTFWESNQLTNSARRALSRLAEGLTRAVVQYLHPNEITFLQTRQVSPTIIQLFSKQRPDGFFVRAKTNILPTNPSGLCHDSSMVLEAKT